ncbi:hypothetical protein HKX48_003080 [Thoreauomyces humboldtii]|nr:hypothetical protein HKX48_003080 [Thoreauomyces humboldtii]
MFALLALLGAATLLFTSFSTSSSAAHRAVTGMLRKGQDAMGPRKRTIAAIVDGRPMANLLPSVIHFSAVLGEDWPIHIFKGPDNTEMLNSSPAIQKLLATGGIVLHDIPSWARFNDHMQVSEFYAQTPWFWEQIAPYADNVLMFQLDSVICSNSAYRPEDFLQWDYIGAPIDPKYGVGYNGGFSLRHIQSFLATVRNVNWTETSDVEDQWFAKHLKKIPGIRLPSIEEASPFAVETVWHDRPMAYHQLKRWWPHRFEEAKSYCPDLVLCEDGVLHLKAEQKEREEMERAAKELASAKEAVRLAADAALQGLKNVKLTPPVQEPKTPIDMVISPRDGGDAFLAVREHLRRSHRQRRDIFDAIRNT